LVKNVLKQWTSKTFRPGLSRTATSRAPARWPASASAPRAAQGHPPAEATTKNLVIHDDIHMTFSDFVIDHTASMTNCQILS
jgi:hypothetical protein